MRRIETQSKHHTRATLKHLPPKEQAAAVAEAQQRAVVQAQAAAAAEQVRLQQQQQIQQREQAIQQAKIRREEQRREAIMEREAEEKLRHLGRRKRALRAAQVSSAQEAQFEVQVLQTAPGGAAARAFRVGQEHVTERDEKKALKANSATTERRFDFGPGPGRELLDPWVRPFGTRSCCEIGSFPSRTGVNGI